jgi:hypothetical protein
MVRVNASDPSNPRWTNQTLQGQPLLVSGALEFLRYGRSGILVSFGGFDQNETGNDGFGLGFVHF